VGDPETVCDARGWLPAERRDLSLTLFRMRRESEVRELRARIPAGKAELKALRGRAERARLREALRADAARLASLEEMPPMAAADMCSECGDLAWHSPGVTFNLADGSSTGGPCPAWPRWAQQLEMMRAELRKMAGPAPEPPASVPKPIAVVTLSGPIEEVTAKLAAIQAEHPGAPKCWAASPSSATPWPTAKPAALLPEMTASSTLLLPNPAPPSIGHVAARPARRRPSCSRRQATSLSQPRRTEATGRTGRNEQRDRVVWAAGPPTDSGLGQVRGLRPRPEVTVGNDTRISLQAVG
jgi:hypothetical protein